jgi:hypothetical protein
MRITRRIDDFMIHVGASARGDTDTNMEAIDNINQYIKNANISRTPVQFGGSSKVIDGKLLGKKTILGVFKPETLADFGLPVPTGGYQIDLPLGSQQRKKYLKLFKAEKIKVGRKLKKTTNFIVLNNKQITNKLYGTMIPFHEISHGFSSKAGLTQRDFDNPFMKAGLAFDEAHANPGDFPAYERAFGAYLDRMKGAGLEEARADSGALSFFVKSGIKDQIIDEANSGTLRMQDITGYSHLQSFKGYEADFEKRNENYCYKPTL